MSEEKNYIDDLITRAEYRYNGDERDMTKGNTYVVIRQTEDYIEVLDDHKNDFVKGNFNYSVLHLSRINAYYIELESAKLKDKAPFQVSKLKN